MRIVNEKHLSLLWSWDDYDKDILVRKYQDNLEQLVRAVVKRVNEGKAPAADDIRALAVELQEAGEILHQSVLNCFEAARAVYEQSGETDAEREQRHELFETLNNHIGKPVILSQTSIPELEGKHLILEEIQGVKGILRDGDNLWEAMVDFLVPVLATTTPTINDPDKN